MSNETNNNVFEFNYSAKQQEEIKKIRERYLPREEEEDKMETLRRLDESATQKGTVVALIAGILGSLVMGTGMSCVMVWGGSLTIPGIIIGVIGMIGVALAYPLYMRITKKERERIAPEIIRLTDELMK